MKKFQFRLQPVLRVRRIQEEQARARLQDANRDALLAARRVEERVLAYDDTPRPSGVLTHDEYERVLFHLDAALGAIDVARAAHHGALLVVDERRIEWAATKQRVAALERLEARQRSEYLVELRRDEDRLVDDLVVARHARRPRPNRTPDLVLEPTA